MSNDILGNLPHGQLSFWKPSVYTESVNSKQREEYYKCPAGEAMGLIPSIYQQTIDPNAADDNDGALHLTGIKVETHESVKVDFITLTYSATSKELTQAEAEDGEEPEYDGYEVETTISMVDEPLAQHPKFKDDIEALDNTLLRNLSALCSGQATDEHGNDIATMLTGRINEEFLKRILRGQTHYKAPYIQARLTIPKAVTITDAGKITSHDRLPALPDGQTWLGNGGGVTKKDGKAVTQITYLGGHWDAYLYENETT